MKDTWLRHAVRPPRWWLPPTTTVYMSLGLAPPVRRTKLEAWSSPPHRHCPRPVHLLELVIQFDRWGCSPETSVSLDNVLKACVNLRLCDQGFQVLPPRSGALSLSCPCTEYGLWYGFFFTLHCLLHNVSLHDNQVVRQRWVVAGVAGSGCRALLPKHRQAEWPTLVRIQGSEAWEGLVAGEDAGSGARPRPPRAQRRYNSMH